MKKINKIVLITLLSSSVSFANESKESLVEVLENTDMFIGVSLGYSNLNVKQEGSVSLNEKLEKNSNNFALELGYNYSKNIDISLNYKRVNLDDVGLDNLYASIKYKFEEIYTFVPYFGLNLGYSQLSWDKIPVNTIDNDIESGSILLGASLGVMYPITKNTSLNLNYALDYINHKTYVEYLGDESTIEHNYLQGINLGIRYLF